MGSIEHMGEKTNNRVNDKYQNRKDVQEISNEHSLPEKNNKFNDKWKIILQNTRGLITPNSKEKVGSLEICTTSEKILMINVTETWFNNDITDEEANIKGYKIFRGDRNEIKQGGTAIYLNDKVEAEKLGEISFNKCEMVAIKIPEIQTINIVVYRPPGTKFNEFNVILKKLQEMFKELEKPEPTIILSGDFNFPFVKWSRLENNSCTWDYSAKSNATKDEKKQFEKLINICYNQCMIQIIEENTRGENTLDLIFTNEPNVISAIDVNKTWMSDHRQIEVSTNYILNEQLNHGKEMEDPNTDLRSLNFRAKEKIDWKGINENIGRIQWKELFEKGNAIETTEEFLNKIAKISMENIPKKRKEEDRKIPKDIKKLVNRIKMLKRDKHKAKSEEKKKAIENKIVETEVELLERKRRKKLEGEKKAIECMKDNPKMFYSLVNKQKNRKNEVGPFKVGEEIINDGKEICNRLVSEYYSQFSETSERENENAFQKIDPNDLNDIEIEEKDLEDAIDDLNENSSAGPDGIPAIFLKKTKEEIAVPLTLILRKSLDEGRIHDIFKLAYISPIHKGGSRQKPEQYRPVSLTSHVMKVFERVVKKKIIKHLVDNQKFNEGQHGFVPGRGTQTQLLAHYNDIYEALMEGRRLDTIFLDFAKAFDKVDHNILLEKVKKHKIGGKIGLWIGEFLRGRKFRVVANGCMSREEDVISGVPQGTVLAAILFVIMISDIDENVKKCIVRSFADDTRMNKKISNDKDKELMQKDLEAIYDWARENKMKFNENKFEQMAHGNIKNVTIDPYKTPCGEEIQIKDTVKDLGVLVTNDLKFKEHINNVTSSSRITMGMLLRTFTTREKDPMIKMFNAYIKSKLEYCCIVWSPYEQRYINELENIQRIFTSKIDGMEGLNYHERLKKLKMYSLERRRDRYLIIYGWQQIESIKENVLRLELSERNSSRSIKSRQIPYYGIDGRKRILPSEKTKILQCPAMKIERVFNCMPRYLRDKTRIKTETFKKHLDKWLSGIPDQPKCGRYSGYNVANSNSIQDQCETNNINKR